ncbi:MAG: hypothetical protein CVV39_02285 [Planctomycetes bacterium HGW-Planctomycetes-1]|nr:MAG: hypothetical protein CVV39_02285 [Planctomycetes bacterium HGW-Planctomycetes-1]
MNKFSDSGQNDCAAGELTGRFISKQDFIYIIILTIVALVIGVYLIATTVLISKDGIFYIKQTQNLSNDLINTIREHPPGYPFLIFLTHRFASLFGCGTSIQCWCYCAQSTSLLCRLLAIIPLYFIGKLLIGDKNSFWAILILIILPYPAASGSDVLREWPHILFLAASLLFLILGSKSGKWWVFAITGFTAGLGHLIRPECAQTVIYGSVWLLINLFSPRPNINRLKSIYLIAAIIIGFMIPTIPYFKIKGEILPPKLKKLISNTIPGQLNNIEQTGRETCTASAVPIDTAKASVKFIQMTSDNMMHFFILPLVIGFYTQYRRTQQWLFTGWFFILILLAVYFVMAVLLYINYGYISRRHDMPFIVFAIFYVPLGLQILASWLNKKTSKINAVTGKNVQKWFIILTVTGLSLCAAKFIRIVPLRWDKQGYRDTAEWLTKNTDPADIIAVPDRRITFYAQRQDIEYDEKIPVQENGLRGAGYIVFKNKNGKLELNKETKEVYSTLMNKREKNLKISTYKVSH